MSLVIALQSEILKAKRTASFYLTVIAAAFGPFMSLLDVLFSERLSAEDGKIIFNKIMTDKFQMTGLVILPMFIVLICTLLPQIEYKNKSWKQVLASPQTKGNVFVAKFINIHLMILLFLVANQLFMVVTVSILHFKEPSLHVLDQALNVYNILVNLVNIYVALLAMSSIQFWLGLKFKNFLVPIAIGISLWIIGTLLVVQLESGFAVYFPYSFHVYGSFPQYNSQLNTVHLTSAVYAAISLVLGFIDFNKSENRQ